MYTHCYIVNVKDLRRANLKRFLSVLSKHFNIIILVHKLNHNFILIWDLFMSQILNYTKV
jgi:hypothetical protein